MCFPPFHTRSKGGGGIVCYSHMDVELLAKLMCECFSIRGLAWKQYSYNNYLDGRAPFFILWFVCAYDRMEKENTKLEWLVAQRPTTPPIAVATGYLLYVYRICCAIIVFIYSLISLPCSVCAFLSSCFLIWNWSGNYMSFLIDSGFNDRTHNLIENQWQPT